MVKMIFRIIAGIFSLSVVITNICCAAGITVTDQLGRQIVLPDVPQRLVTMAPSITEIVYVLEQQHRLKGVSMFSDFPPEASQISKIGSYVHLDLERIIALNPDLCIAVKDGNPRKTVMRLEELDIPVYAVNPVNLNSVMESVLEIGILLNATIKAKTIVKNMSLRIQAVKSLIHNTSQRPLVFFQIGVSPIVSAGTGTFIDEFIDLAGGRNIASGMGQYPRFSREQVIALKPDIIIISSMARANPELFEKAKQQWNLWPDIPAVRNNRIYIVDSNIFDRPGPRMVDGLELLAEMLHPDIFRKLP